jgi:hypothetical protein
MTKYRNVVNFYHQVPLPIANFMEIVLTNLQYIIKHNHLVPEYEQDINLYFNKLKNIYLKNSKQYKNVTLQIFIKPKKWFYKIFNMKEKNNDVVDLILTIGNNKYNYKDFLCMTGESNENISY